MELMKQVNLFMLTLFLTCSLYSQEPGQWKVLKTGAGGWITGLDIHPSGSIMYARSDVGGAYRYDNTTQRWTQVVTASSIPSEDIAWDRYQGVQSIVSDPTDDDRAYMAYDQNIYFSQDQGDTWQKTNFPEQELRANDDGSKLAGERLAIDPANGQVVYYGSIEEGLYRTLDGQNWTKITAVPQGLEGRGVRSILFDSNGGMVAGRTARIYVVVDGVGVMRSNDGGTTWSNIVDNQFFTFGMPLIYDAEIDAQGRLYICGEDLDDKGDADPFNDDYLNIGVLRFSDDNWTQILLPNIAMGEIATDPFDPDRLMVFSEGFTDTYRTNNSTSPSPTWTFMSYDISAPNIPWLDSDANNWFTLGEIIFDPIQEDRIWISHGTGVYYADNLNADNYTWTEESIDQEHLVSNDVVALSNGDVITAHWDFPMFLHEDVDTYPSEIKPRDRFNDVWDIAQSASDEDFLVAIVEDKRFCCFDDGYARNSSYSEDGGETWTPFASMPESPTTMIFGMSAVSTGDNNNIVWLPAGNRMPYYTLDKGDTWTQIVLPGASPNCCIDQIFFKRKVLVADQVLPHTFYIYDWGEGHIFKSMDGGVSWIKYSEVLGVFSFHAKLASVPDRAGHLLFANGPEQSRSLIEPLSISEDGGQTWTQLENKRKDRLIQRSSYMASLIAKKDTI